jgi:peptidoglycan-associated lipoprotein
MAVLAVAFSGCKPKYPKCDKDEQCAEKGEVCVEGMCQQCRDDSTCPGGQACKAGRCEAKAECAKDGDCTGGKVCKSGKCQIECSADGDCGSGMKCSSNRCVDQLSCNANSDCKGGLTCIAGRCGEAQNASRAMCSYPKVRFGFNEAALTPEAKAGLEQVAACVKEKSSTITVEGHCDERGTEEYNLALGDQRANAVKKYLERLGVPASKLNVVSKGENQPLVNRSDEEAWAENRRAEFEER